MTTHSPLLLPHARSISTRLRPTYVPSSATPPSLRFNFPRRNYSFPPKFTMPSAISAAFNAFDELNFPLELDDEFDFDRIVSSDGLITICGFGSLLSGQKLTQFI